MYYPQRFFSCMNISLFPKDISFRLFCDGASRGNPGRASAGFWIEKNGEVLHEGGKDLGIATNNVAEWTALLLGVEAAKSLGITELDVFLDSELVVKQMRGEYRVKNEILLPIFRAVQKEVSAFFRISFSHIPRAKNSRADALANSILDADK